MKSYITGGMCTRTKGKILPETAHAEEIHQDAFFIM